MTLAMNLVFFAIACLFLVVSGGLLVRTLLVISSFLRLSHYIVSFLLMAFSTSLPELFIGIDSALAGNPALSLGNIIGANIADLTLVIGVTVLLAPKFNVKNPKVKKDTYLLAGIAALPLVLMFIGQELSRIDGAILLGAFAYMAYRETGNKKGEHHLLRNHIAKKKLLGAVFGFALSLLVLYISADWVVYYGNALALDLDFPKILVGLVFLALGTTLPELVFGSRAVLSGHAEFALGNIIGSVVVNSTLILGIVALIYPIQANFLLFLVSAVFMIVVFLVFLTFVQSGKLTKNHGIVLLMLYVLFLIVELTLKGVIAV